MSTQGQGLTDLQNSLTALTAGIAAAVAEIQAQTAAILAAIAAEGGDSDAAVEAAAQAINQQAAALAAAVAAAQQAAPPPPPPAPAPWLPNNVYAAGATITDPSGNIETATTPGTSGAAIPAFPTGAAAVVGATTPDGVSPTAMVWTLTALAVVASGQFKAPKPALGQPGSGGIQDRR